MEQIKKLADLPKQEGFEFVGIYADGREQWKIVKKDESGEIPTLYVDDHENLIGWRYLDMLNKITQAIICNQLALYFNENIKGTNYYRHKVKGAANMLISELIKSEPEYDKFFDADEERTKMFYDVFSTLVNEIAESGMAHFENITNVIRAYKKNPASMNGIVNKILRP